MKRTGNLLAAIALLGAFLFLSGCCGMYHHRHVDNCPQAAPQGDAKPCCPDTVKPAGGAQGK